MGMFDYRITIEKVVAPGKGSSSPLVFYYDFAAIKKLLGFIKGTWPNAQMSIVAIDWWIEDQNKEREKQK